MGKGNNIQCFKVKANFLILSLNGCKDGSV